LSFSPSPQHNQEPFLVESFLSSTFRIATLNCRSLVKINELSRRQVFIRFLRKQNPPLDIITLQETHASTIELKLVLDNLFQTKQTLWSKHCGIACFNPSLHLTPDFITIDQRVIKCTITDSQRTFDPITNVTIYAPAQLSERQQFFSSIIEMPIIRSREDTPSVNLPSTSTTLPSRTIITGDFNYNLRDVSTSLTGQQALINHQFRWNQALQSNFLNCLDSRTISPTFRRGQQMSSIDYIYSTSDLYSDKIKSTLRWDRIKDTVQKIARKTSRHHANWRKKHLDVLQLKRSSILNNSSMTTAALQFTLSKVEAKIQGLQEEMSTNNSLRAQKFWWETGESSPSFLKRSITTRLTKSFIPELLHPITSASCTTLEALTDAAHSFYQSLYTPDDTNLNAIDLLAETIHSSSVLDESQSEHLLTEFSKDDLLDAAKRTPPKSSPGIDGIPYQILFHMLHNAAALRVAIQVYNDAALRVAIQVYNDALLKSIFPPSWHKTCMILLPKKGDLTNLSNHRPISLINTDAKLFTRMLNSRLMMYMNDLISPQQMGFMPSRFIGENGKTLQAVMSIAEHTSSNAIGLLLDQEKAYDRIHPTYLAQMMTKFGIPSQIISSLCTLFFNGHLSTPVLQQRGLRQGDPISPLLFNIAFDPFLRSVQ
ncbi:hypothetical protein INT47_007388, partial [Mucor saturninus]